MSFNAATITTGDPTSTPVCADGSSTISVPYTVTSGSASGSYSVLLSDASGSFASGTTTLSTTSTGSPLAVTIPKTVAGGTGYLVKAVVGGNAASANPTAFTINNVSIAPTAAQSVAINTNGTKLDATEKGGTATARQWYYSTTSGSGYTNAIGGATGASYTPNFPTAGTYYVVVQTTFPASGSGTCTVTSNEVAITVTNPTITLGTLSQTSYCATSPTDITLPFTTSAPFSAGVTFSVQISPSSSFASGIITLATVSVNPSSSTAYSITATIPANTTNGTYYARVISSTPPVTSTNVRTITVIGNQSVAIAPTTAQTISRNGGTGTTLTATETPSGAATRQWYYSTTSGSGYTNAIGGATATTYAPKGSDFPGVGTYYVVETSSFTTCGTSVTSNEVAVTVADSRIVVSPTSLTGFLTQDGTPSAAQTYTLQAYDLPSTITTVTATPPTTAFEVAYSAGLTPSTPTSAYSRTGLNIPRADALAGVTIYVRLSAVATGTPVGDISNSAGAGVVAQVVSVSGTVTTLTVSGTPLSAFSTSVGTPSASRSFTVAGSNLTDPVTVAAPGGYEVSLTNAVGSFAASQTITPASGSVSATVYVRLMGTTAGPYSGNVVVSSPNATTRNVAVTGSVLSIAAEPTVQPTITVSNIGFSQADITLSGGNGQKRLVVLRTPSASGFTAPADNTTYAASTTLGSSTMQGSGNYIMVADGTTVTATLTNLTPNINYTVSVYAYNDDNNAGQENYLTTAPGTASLSTIATPTVYYAKATGDLNQLATYGFNADGSGQSPTGFTTAGRTFNVSGTSRTIGAAWTVSGTGSKVVLAANSTFVVPATAGVTFTGTLDQGANSTLVIQNTTFSGIKAGTQNATSTIDFAQTGTVTLPSTTTLPVQNLKLTGGTKVFALNGGTVNNPVTSTIIPGNLTIDGATVQGAGSGAFSTVELSGNLTLLNGATFNNASASRITLTMAGTGTQTLFGNGSTIRLFRLRTGAGGNQVVLSDANGGTPVEVGNASSGGIELFDTSTLVLNANTLSSYPNGRAVFNRESQSFGTFTLSAASSLVIDSQAPVFGFLTPNPAANTVGNLTITNANGDALQVYGSDLIVAGTLTFINAASGIYFPGQALTLNGPVVGPGVIYGDATSDLTIGGTGALAPLTFASSYRELRNLTLNRAGTATLGSPLVMNGALTLTNGILTNGTNLLTLAATSTVSGGSATSFVSGPVARPVPATSNAANVFTSYLFPVGKGVAYRPLTLNVNTQSNAITYRTEQFEGDPGQLGTDPTATDGTTLTRVSRVRSFTVTPYVGSTVTQPTGFSGTVSLSYDAYDLANLPAAVVIAKRSTSGQPWVNINRSGNTTSTVTSGVFSTFSDFALASTDASAANNPLPVELSRFGAQRQDGKAVAVQWSTASEKNADRFEVQRSLDGHEFMTVATAQAQGTSSKATAYAVLDQTAPAAALYYRLRQVDRDGTVALSPVVSIAGTGEVAKVLLYPNPTSSSIRFMAEAAMSYRVLNQLGQAVLQGTTEAGSAKVAVESLPVGLYILELQTPAGRSMQKFEKQ